MPVVIDQSLFSLVQRFEAPEAKRVWTFLEKLQRDPSQPSLSLEKAVDAKSPGVWSGRISKSLRAILLKDGDNWIVVHADTHDAAYNWAAQRRIERNAATGMLLSLIHI